MALVQTTLNGAISATQNFITLTADTRPASVNGLIKVDSEFMKPTDVSATPVIKVQRGVNGTLAVAHATLATAVVGTPSEFTSANGQPLVDQPGAFPVFSVGADGALPIPVVDATIEINKATAAVLTLASPAKDQNNRVTIRSNSAAAHTVTYTPGFYADTTSSDVATFAAKAGASMTIEAQRGVWGVVSLANVTLA